jgi:capsular polysaccharide biosynthesis protein
LSVGTDSLGRPRSLWDTAFEFNKANFVAALICGLLVAALAGAIVLTRPAKYESTATIAVDQPALIASGGDRVIDKLQRIRVKYAPLLKTVVMTGPLAKQLGTTPANLRGTLSATTPTDNVLILVKATTGSRSQSQNYAAKATDFLASYAKDEQARDSVPAAQQFQLVVVDQARPGTKTEPSQARAVAFAVVAGLIALGAVYVALQLLRPRAAPSDEQ